MIGPAEKTAPIIAFAPNSWDGRTMSRQQLLSRLAKRGWPIIYSTGALWAWQRSSPEWKEAPWRGEFLIRDRMIVDRPGKAVPRSQGAEVWDQFALRFQARRLAMKAGPDWRWHGIAFLFNPIFWPYVDALQPKYVVFHAYDAFPLMGSNWTPDRERMLTRLAERADILSATTAEVVSTFPNHLQSKARLLENGSDSQIFIKGRAQPCPHNLASIPHPRIGYIGTVNRKTDFAVINGVARSRPDWHWILMGHVDERLIHRDREAREGYIACRSLPNVHYFDPVRPNEVPAYVAHMDVNTICYRIREGEWGFACYPLKLHEYLAAGKPVVSSAISVIREKFSSVVGVATSAREWEAAIDDAIENGGVGTLETRQAVAAQNSWDQRVDCLENWLTSALLEGRAPAAAE